MSGDPLTLVVYAGQMATYVCEGGDVQPTYPILHSITEEVLRLLRQEQRQSTAPDHSTSASSSSTTYASGDRASLLKQQAQELRCRLLPLMQGRFVLLVVPLSSTASYREEWTQLCFDECALARRLVMLADTVASAFACGMDSCVVVHASLSTVSMCRVEAGCSTRHSNSHMGSLQMLCGAKLSLQLTEEWPKVTFSVTASDSNSVPELVPSNDAEVTAGIGGDTDMHLGSSGVGALVDLASPKHRDALIHAFGFKAYSAVVVRSQMEAQEPQVTMTTSSKGKGKGGGRQRASSLLDELRQVYPRAVRRRPGQLEKLLARVVHGGSTTPASAVRHDGGEPCVLAGEALAIPYVYALFAYVVKRCGDDVWAIVQRERRARKRSLTTPQLQHRPFPNDHEGHRGTTNKAESGETHSGASGACDEVAPATHRQNSSTSSSTRSGKGDSEDEGVENESSCSNSSSHSSSVTSLLGKSEKDTWLRLQETPLPEAPWWLPLLGGSIVSRLTDQDVQRALITAEEARETKGTVVHWKMLL
uniref:Actin-like protein n=1 Tax=Leishmania naiffi TaxID=5678 RepID=A0AAW3BH86_9TRYP